MSEKVVIQGGNAFIKQFVEDTVKWVQHVNEPMFLVRTEWTTPLMPNDIHSSMLIQWHNGKNRLVKL